MQSVRAGQPVRAGYGSDAMRINFLAWARENLSAEDVLRLKDIDQTYRKTAIGLRLVKPTSDITSADLAAAMEKITAKAGG